MSTANLFFLKEFFINIFTVPHFDDKDNKPVIVDFVNNSIITGPYFVKGIIPLHFGGSRIRQVCGKTIYPFLDSDQVFWGEPF